MKKCIICEVNLEGNKKKFCSNKCSMKYKYLNNKEVLNRNTYARQVELSIKRKITLIKLRGDNGCERCGYKKNIAALDLHHVDSNLKNFPLDARNLSNRNWESILVEFEKCVFLCANCHREHHNEEFTYNEILITKYSDK
jgi:hypothetical protein